MEESSCVGCGAVLFEPAGAERGPCPVCGALARRVDVALQDTLVAHDGYRLKHYKEGSKAFSVDERSGPSYYKVGAEWHHLERTIDRENDRYIEVVRVLRTGEIIRSVDEPLSLHRGRGGSKNQGGSGAP